MIEVKLLNYLTDNLSVKAFNEKKPFDSYVLIELISSERTNFINQSTFEIHSYAKTKYQASLLNREVIKLMDNFARDNDISSSYFGNSFEDTDTSEKKYCYTCVYEITYY